MYLKRTTFELVFFLTFLFTVICLYNLVNKQYNKPINKQKKSNTNKYHIRS